MAKLAAAQDLGSCAERRGGSNPLRVIMELLQYAMGLCLVMLLGIIIMIGNLSDKIGNLFDKIDKMNKK